MKSFLTLLLICIYSITGLAGQSRASGQFKFTVLNSQDTLISGWKFRAGDSPSWSAVHFDDHSWKSFDPTQDVKNIPGEKIHWMRIRLSVGSDLVGKPLAIIFNQFVASEYYLDGLRIATYGGVSPKVVGQKRPANPLKITLSDLKDHVLAIRFAKPAGLPDVRFHGEIRPVAEIRIGLYPTVAETINQDNADGKPRLAVYMLFVGVCIILSIIHLSIFALTRDRAHLFYGLFNIVGTYEGLAGYLLSAGVHSPVTYIWINLIAWVMQNFLFLMTLTVYAFFGYRNKLMQRVLAGISLLAILMLWTSPQIGFFMTVLVVPIVNLIETIRVGIWAGKRKMPGAVFVIVGVSLFFTLLSAANLVGGGYGYILIALAQVFFPIGMAIFLAMQTALTNRTLQEKLIEVKVLSEQNLKQEREQQRILAHQNEELEEQVGIRTAELTSSLETLKQTQTQLIQSEKMASLGELTAGIAHEIQNPLNFVNNFSEVSIELLDEMNEELEKGDTKEAFAISADIKENLQKIGYHGHRADSIVKGMLQHSRVSGGKKELININPLVEEHLRLAYHGLRVKNKSFNAELITDFAEDLPMLNLLPQDMGRALLNIFNNAFYALQEKTRIAGVAYLATATVRTALKDGQVYISIHDNGIGIPEAIKEKIMHPFFTTKPTGSGTGLGLSLTYDIVVKGHNGQIVVDSVEGEGTTFTLILPLGLARDASNSQ